MSENQSESETLKEFAKFQNTVYEHSVSHSHVSKGLDKNTLSILPIIIPPKFASLLTPNNIPPNFINKLATIENLNTAIVGLNRCFAEPVVIWTNTYGIRNKAKKNRTDEHPGPRRIMLRNST